jgi:transposase
LEKAHYYYNGLDKVRDAAVTDLTLPYGNGPIEDVNTKIKCLSDSDSGDGSFGLLCKRILLTNWPRHDDRPHT